ncbi:hypothetical protein FG386_003000 [Cryptosporidium ryanae]|uniref:uncharacterized protein n=1 Tax=Cryptosporidium ryanae TaxID=515981 RepID=UPI00351A8067|nr:hypothetical protein FG386_003000 [Cryptosporidium ryanae]
MECLINKEVNNKKSKNVGLDLEIMIIMGISSFINYCITMLWPLIAVGVTSRIPFQIFLSLVEVLVTLILGLISDAKSRMASIKYSFKIILFLSVLSLLLVSGNLLTGYDLLKFDLIYIRDSESFVGYDNILLYDDSLNIIGKVNIGEHLVSEELLDVVIESHDGKNIKNHYYSSNHLKSMKRDEEFKVNLFTLILFAIFGILRSSSISIYYTMNVLVYEVEMKDAEYYGDNRNLCWMKMCFCNIWRFLSILIVRATFISLILIFLGNKDLDKKNNTINNYYSYMFSINIIILILLAFYGIYIINNKLNYFKEVVYTDEIDSSGVSICFNRLISFLFSKKNRLFIFILVPWWILNFIQTGNNFCQWVLPGDNPNNIEWWELYLLLFESMIALLISIWLSIFPLLLSPAIIQVCCFVLISVVSSGLTICTYTFREIPIKSFTDFTSAFLLCHGIFHLCCVVPSMTILFLTIDSASSKIRSSVLSLVQIVISTAPFFDMYINNHMETINASLKLLIITSITILGLFFSGLFMNRYLGENSSPIEYDDNNSIHSLELLPIYREVANSEKHLINRENKLYTF